MPEWHLPGAGSDPGSYGGTPFENGIADLQAQLADARAAGNPIEVERLEAELAEAIENAKPGKGPNDSWATADLDVNDDGVVDRRDLDALDVQAVRLRVLWNRRTDEGAFVL